MSEVISAKLSKKPEKILAIAGGNYIYGAEKVTLDVLEGLKKKGYDFTALTTGWGDGEFSVALKRLDVKYYRLKLGWYYVSNLRWSLDSLINYPGALIRFLLIRGKILTRIIYIIHFRPVIVLWPFIKGKIVYHVHDVNSLTNRTSFFIKMIDKKVVKYIAISKYIKTDLEKIGINPDKIEVIYNGTTIVKEQSKLIDSEYLTLGIVGQIIERKGHLYVAKVLKVLIEKGLKIKLKIIGNGDEIYKDQVNKYLLENDLLTNVEWIGFIKNPVDIYVGIDIILALTLTEEPFGLTVIEANMQGLPVLASNKSGFLETVIDGYNGYLVDPENINEIAKKIEILYYDRNHLSLMGSNGRKRVLENFTTDIMIEKICNLIESI